MRKQGLLVAVCVVMVAWLIAVMQSHPDAEETPAAQARVSQPDPAHAAKCRELLANTPKSWLADYDVGDVEGNVRAVVGLGYYGLTFDLKDALDQTLRCFASQGRANSAGLNNVYYRDQYTNKIVATWSRRKGFAME